MQMISDSALWEGVEQDDEKKFLMVYFVNQSWRDQYG